MSVPPYTAGGALGTYARMMMDRADDAIENAAQQQQQHTYPPGYEPGRDWALDICWKGFDLLKPGTIPQSVREFLCGYFCAALKNAAKDGEPKA